IVLGIGRPHVQVAVLLERGDHHPVEREHREGREAQDDQPVPERGGDTANGRPRHPSPHDSRTGHARGGRVTWRGPGGRVLRPPPTPYRSPGEPFPLWGRCVVVSRSGKGSADPSPRPPPLPPPDPRDARS